MSRVFLQRTGDKIKIVHQRIGTDGSPIYSPDPIFPFSSFLGVRKKDGENYVVWTLAKDREKANIWTGVGGGEVDFIVSSQLEPGVMMDFSWQAIQESWEESGVKVDLWGMGPFWTCVIPYYYDKHVSLISDTGREDQDERSAVRITGAHGAFFYYCGEILGNPQLIESNGPESIYDNVAMKQLTVQETFAAFKSGEIHSFDSFKEAFIRFAWILLNPDKNPFTHKYDEDWCVKEGLMERPWKDKILTCPLTPTTKGLII